MEKYKTKVLNWSNILFLLPFALAINYGLYIYALIIGLVLIVSFFFHFKNEPAQLYLLDVLLSIALMISNLVLLFKGYFATPYSIIALTSVFIALIFFFRERRHSYNWNHSLWHIFSAIGSTFCLLTFLFSTP